MDINPLSPIVEVRLDPENKLDRFYGVLGTLSQIQRQNSTQAIENMYGLMARLQDINFGADEDSRPLIIALRREMELFGQIGNELYIRMILGNTHGSIVPEIYSCRVKTLRENKTIDFGDEIRKEDIEKVMGLVQIAQNPQDVSWKMARIPDKLVEQINPPLRLLFERETDPEKIKTVKW